MRCVRFEDPRTGHQRIGYIDGDVIRCVYGTLETYWQITDETYDLEDVQLLAPCVPKQIICVSFNFKKHAAEFGVEIPQEPSIFSKAAHTVIGRMLTLSGPDRWRSWPLVWSLALLLKRR